MKKGLHLAYQVAKTNAVQPTRLRALSKVRAQQLKWTELEGATTFVASKEGALKGLATLFSRSRVSGDCFLFYGDVGVGKSTFSRAYIRSAAEDPFLQVPSPTFLLKNSYDLPGSPVVNHFDLFRLGEHADWSRLQLQESFQSGVSLVEWAERLQGPLPSTYLGLHLCILHQVPEWMREQEAKVRHSLLEPEYAMAGHHGQGGEEDEEYEEGEEGVGYLFEDRRWRVVRLQPVGERWQQRVEEVKVVVKHGGIPGLLLVEDEEAEAALGPATLPSAGKGRRM